MDYSFTMVRGDTVSFGVELLDEYGDPFTQDLDAAYFSVRQDYDGNILSQVSIGGGISKTEENVYVVRIAPEKTKNIPAGSYYYDFEVQINGDSFTFLRGVVIIKANVTQN